MKKFKKFLNILSYAIPIFVIVYVCLYFCNTFNIIDLSDFNINDFATFNFSQNNSLSGVVIYKNDEYFELMTNNDSLYKFSDQCNCIVGDWLTIKYKGKIDYFNKIQNVNVKKIIKSEKKQLYSQELYEILNDMSLEEKIGQLLLARIPVKDKIEAIQEFNLGGYILFQRDVSKKSKNELINDIKSFQSNSKIPLFIAIDEEGGSVSRLSSNEEIVSEPFLSSQDLYNNGGYKAIRDDAIRKVKLLTELGININLAPVADVSTNPDSYIYSRTFGKGSEETSKYIKTVLETQNNDVTFVLKHFPGYADNSNTHNGISIDNKDYTSIKNNDFKPFKTGIDNGAKAIMVAHNIMTAIEDVPASLSLNAHNILRNELNFNGIIMTDDLNMAATARFDKPYLKAVKAGNNILVVTDYDKAYNEIYDGISNKQISEELINRLVLRVLNLKEEKGLKKTQD